MNEEKMINTVTCGDNVELLKKLPDESVDVVITSPPYWGLRDYGKHSEKIWGGDPNCDHDFSEKYTRHQEAPGKTSKVKQKGLEYTITTHTCTKCGAWKGQFGLEPHPQMYIEHSVEIFREVKRVLKNTGSFYLNLGDSYYNSPAGNKDVNRFLSKSKIGKKTMKEQLSASQGREFKPDGKWLQSKQLLLIPTRVAQALQEDGWILRNDILWAKPNPMPCSVTDRLNNTYEHIFHFVKQQKYYYDLDAIRVPPDTGFDYIRKASAQKGNEGAMNRQGEDDISNNILGKNPGDFHDIFNDEEYQENMRKARLHIKEIIKLARNRERKSYHGKYKDADKTDGKSALDNVATIRQVTKEYIKEYIKDTKLASIIRDYAQGYAGNINGKNPGDFYYIGDSYSDIWKVMVKPFPEAHFAVYPPELVELPLKSSCPLQICKKCGKPRERETEDIDVLTPEQKEKLKKQREKQQEYIENTKGENATGSGGCIPSSDLLPVAHMTVGWTDCKCGAGFSPGIVLDPFMGSGTTGLVAKQLGYRYIGFEVNPEYCKMANKRINKFGELYEHERRDGISFDELDYDFEVKSFKDESRPLRKKKQVVHYDGELSIDDMLSEEPEEIDTEQEDPLDKYDIKTINLKDEEDEKEEEDDIWNL